MRCDGWLVSRVWATCIARLAALLHWLIIASGLAGLMCLGPPKCPRRGLVSLGSGSHRR